MPRLHEFGVRREALWGVHAQQIRRVNNCLALQALHVVKGLADSAAMDRHDHGFGVQDVTVLSPDPRQLVARPLLEISERATDIAIAYHCYFISLLPPRLGRELN